VSFADAAARNLLLPVDLFCMLGLFLIAIHPRAKRLGDLVAGTVVVRDQPALAPASVTAEQRMAADEDTLGPPLTRSSALWSGASKVSCLLVRTGYPHPWDIAERFQRNETTWCLNRHQEERARRQEIRPALQSQAARGGATVARKAARWSEFQQLAERVARLGLDSLSAPNCRTSRALRVAAIWPGAHVRRRPMIRACLSGWWRRTQRAVPRAPHTWRRIWAFIRNVPAPRHFVALHPVCLTFMPRGRRFPSDVPARPRAAPDVMIERARRRAPVRRGLRGDRRRGASACRPASSRTTPGRLQPFRRRHLLRIGSLILLAFNGLSWRRVAIRQCGLAELP
jgi:hypothetical protein